MHGNQNGEKRYSHDIIALDKSGLLYYTELSSSWEQGATKYLVIY